MAGEVDAVNVKLTGDASGLRAAFSEGATSAKGLSQALAAQKTAATEAARQAEVLERAWQRGISTTQRETEAQRAAAEAAQRHAQDIQRLHEAVARGTDALGELGRAAMKVTAGWFAVQTAENAAGAVMEAVKETIRRGTEIMDAQEKASWRLTAALGGNAVAAQDMLAKAHDMANQQPFFREDQIANAEAMLAKFHLTREEVDQLTPRVVAAAAVMGEDVSQMSERIGLGFQGMTRGLNELGIQVATGADHLTTFNAVMQGLEPYTSQAEEAANSFTGQMAQMKQNSDEAAASLAHSLAPALIAVAGLWADVQRAAADMLGGGGVPGSPGAHPKVTLKGYKAPEHDLGSPTAAQVQATLDEYGGKSGALNRKQLTEQESLRKRLQTELLTSDSTSFARQRAVAEAHYKQEVTAAHGDATLIAQARQVLHEKLGTINAAAQAKSEAEAERHHARAEAARQRAEQRALHAQHEAHRQQEEAARKHAEAMRAAERQEQANVRAGEHLAISMAAPGLAGNRGAHGGAAGELGAYESAKANLPIGLAPDVRAAAIKALDEKIAATSLQTAQETADKRRGIEVELQDELIAVGTRGTQQKVAQEKAAYDRAAAALKDQQARLQQSLAEDPSNKLIIAALDDVNATIEDHAKIHQARLGEINQQGIDEQLTKIESFAKAAASMLTSDNTTNYGIVRSLGAMAQDVGAAFGPEGAAVGAAIGTGADIASMFMEASDKQMEAAQRQEAAAQKAQDTALAQAQRESDKLMSTGQKLLIHGMQTDVANQEATGGATPNLTAWKKNLQEWMTLTGMGIDMGPPPSPGRLSPKVQALYDAFVATPGAFEPQASGSPGAAITSSAFQQRLGSALPQGYAGGGLVPGIGNSDSVPALLTPGELVLTKEQAAAWMRRGSPQRFGSGGFVGDALDWLGGAASDVLSGISGMFGVGSAVDVAAVGLPPQGISPAPPPAPDTTLTDKANAANYEAKGHLETIAHGINQIADQTATLASTESNPLITKVINLPQQGYGFLLEGAFFRAVNQQTTRAPGGSSLSGVAKR